MPAAQTPTKPRVSKHAAALIEQDIAVIRDIPLEGPPSDAHLIDVARLWTRYQANPKTTFIINRLQKIVDGWGMTREDVNAMTRALWSKGWRPGGHLEDVNAGSGADVLGG